jgi:ankyrin repeat domain-containing protein 50
LAGDYKKHLNSRGDDHPDPLSTPESTRSIVEQLVKDRETKQWRLPLAGKDINIREEAEKLVKFFIWSDGVIKSALSTQPYAALAWSGVSILLPVILIPLILPDFCSPNI